MRQNALALMLTLSFVLTATTIVCTQVQRRELAVTAFPDGQGQRQLLLEELGKAHPAQPRGQALRHGEPQKRCRSSAYLPVAALQGYSLGYRATANCQVEVCSQSRGNR